MKKRRDCFVAGAPRNDGGIEGEEYEAEEIATSCALATTSSDCRASPFAMLRASVQRNDKWEPLDMGVAFDFAGISKDTADYSPVIPRIADAS